MDWKRFFNFLFILIGCFFMFVFLIYITGGAGWLISSFRKLRNDGAGLNTFRILAVTFDLFIFSISSYWGYQLAKKRGRNPVRWSVICFFLTIWGILILYSLKAPNKLA